MTHDDVGALLVEQVAIALGKAVRFEPSTDDNHHNQLIAGEHRLPLTYFELDELLDAINTVAPPLRPGRFAAAVAAFLISGAMDGLIEQRAAAIGRAVKPFAERYAERFRAMEGGAKP